MNNSAQPLHSLADMNMCELMFFTEELRQAVIDGNCYLVERALACKKAYNVDLPDNKGYTLLMNAVVKGLQLVLAVFELVAMVKCAVCDSARVWLWSGCCVMLFLRVMHVDKHSGPVF